MPSSPHTSTSTSANNTAIKPATHSDAHPSTESNLHGHGYMSDKSKYLARLRRIEGQARGIHRMVEEDTYCIDILTQISATTSALENVALALLDDHLKHCVATAVENGGSEAEEKLKEATEAIKRLVKS